MNTVISIKTERIVAHSGYSRVVMDLDIVNIIRQTIRENGGLPSKFALKVRAIDDETYQVIDGHIRLRAIIDEKCSETPCIVVEKDDYEAYMALIEENVCQEITALDIGIHALAFEPGTGGRGNRSDLTTYAKRIGRNETNVCTYRRGAEVYSFIKEGLTYEDKLALRQKAIPLSLLKSFAQESWLPLAQIILNPKYKEKDLKKGLRLVKQVMSIDHGEKWIDCFLPYSTIIALAMECSTSYPIISHIFNKLNRFEHCFEAVSDMTKVVHLKRWLSENGVSTDSNGNQRLKFRNIDIYCDTAMNEFNTSKTKWVSGDCLVNIPALADKSVSLLLTDPPYGCNYNSINGTTLRRIANDTPEQATTLLKEALRMISTKMKDDCRIIVFSCDDMLVEFLSIIKEAGFKIRNICVWKKSHHTQGDLLYGFRPITEKFIHAVKGKPPLYKPILDHLEFPNSTGTFHATEKPVELLKEIIDACTVPGDLIVDPFAGSGSTVVAAQELNRNWWGCVLDDVDWQNGHTRLFPEVEISKAA